MTLAPKRWSYSQMDTKNDPWGTPLGRFFVYTDRHA